MQLRLTAKLAIMSEHVDFEEQENILSFDGQNLRPHLVINLSNTRSIIVDANALLSRNLELIPPQSKINQEAVFISLTSQIERHIGKRFFNRYWQQFENCPDFDV
jgi:DNA recombination protein RmuC